MLIPYFNRVFRQKSSLPKHFLSTTYVFSKCSRTSCRRIRDPHLKISFCWKLFSSLDFVMFFSCFQRLIRHATGAARRQDLCVQSPQMYRAETFPVLISQIYSFVCSFHAFSQFISRITIKCVRLVATTRTIVVASCTFLKQLMHPAGRGVVVVDPTRCYALVGYWWRQARNV